MDFTLLLTWWTFLYVYLVLPWMYATPTLEYYDYNFSILTNVQFVVVMAGFGLSGGRREGRGGSCARICSVHPRCTRLLRY